MRRAGGAAARGRSLARSRLLDALARGAGSPRGGRARLARSTPPLPTVAPTRAPTVHSLPPSLAGPNVVQCNRAHPLIAAGLFEPPSRPTMMTGQVAAPAGRAELVKTCQNVPGSGLPAPSTRGGRSSSRASARTARASPRCSTVLPPRPSLPPHVPPRTDLSGWYGGRDEMRPVSTGGRDETVPPRTAIRRPCAPSAVARPAFPLRPNRAPPPAPSCAAAPHGARLRAQTRRPSECTCRPRRPPRCSPTRRCPAPPPPRPPRTAASNSLSLPPSRPPLTSPPAPTCPVGTGEGTKCVRLIRGKGRDASG